MSSCAPTSPEDFHDQGERAAAALAKEMSRIHSRDELQAAIPKLRKRYLELARLALAARQLVGQEPLAPSQASDELFAEIARLHELPGGSDLLTFAQAEALKLLE